MMLWMSRRPTRWFVVPNGAEWPDGDVDVQDIGGKTRGADLEALSVYQVTSKEARDFAESMTRQLQAKLDAKLAAQEKRRQALRERTPKEQLDDLLGPVAERFSSQEKMAEFLASFGIDAERIQNAEPEEVLGMLTDVLQPLAEALNDPAARQDALGRMEAALRTHDMDAAADRLAEAPDELRKTLDEWNLR